MIQHVLILMAPQGQDPGSGFMQSILLFGLIFLIFYFMIIRPQQKKQKERQKLLESIKKGDKIVTSGGMHGTIVGMEEKYILVEIADKVKVKIERGSVTTILKEG